MNGRESDERTPLRADYRPTASARSSFLSDNAGSTTSSDEEEWLESTNNTDRSNARQEMRKADNLSRRLLAVQDGDDTQTNRILRKSLKLNHPLTNETASGFFSVETSPTQPSSPGSLRSSGKPVGRLSMRNTGRFRNRLEDAALESEHKVRRKVAWMFTLTVAALVVVCGLTYFQVRTLHPPPQPVGAYQLLERLEGEDFFKAFDFYEGPDSVGSNGYNQYVSRATADAKELVNVTWEEDELDVFGRGLRRGLLQSQTPPPDQFRHAEPFVYLGTGPTPDGPRDSIRLEGIRRFNRGLFIIDIRHMPAGCGLWPAFWLTDEANWPVNGEIDIIEGVNFQSVAKTALHSTRGCNMFDIPLGTMTGGWDSAQGIPDGKTGIPDTTMRYARDCFVYDPHQWLNQGCVAVDLAEGGTMGAPLNDKGGGVYALEWDPINRHIRTWVFTPHVQVPENLVESIRTAHLSDEERVTPNPEEWPLPYGYFSIGVGTECPASHFGHMRMVFNTAFCGSVAGNRYFMDCPKQSKKYKTCNEWIKSEPEELLEAYWKIRGVYVYERAWESTFLN